MWTAVFFTLSYILITNLFTLCLSMTPGSGLVSFILYVITTLIMELIYALFQTGTAAFYLDVASGRRTPLIFDLFYAFTHGPDRVLKVALPLALIRLTCSLPYVIYCLFFMPAFGINELMNMDAIALQSMGISYLLISAGELIYFFVTLMFAPVYFMLVDMPELSAKKTLKMSIWLMKGSKLRLLGLDLSFLPLQFISLLTFGIGTLWVTPYMNTAAAEFYLDLSQKRTNQ